MIDHDLRAKLDVLSAVGDYEGMTRLITSTKFADPADQLLLREVFPRWLGAVRRRAASS